MIKQLEVEGRGGWGRAGISTLPHLPCANKIIEGHIRSGPLLGSICYLILFMLFGSLLYNVDEYM